MDEEKEALNLLSTGSTLLGLSVYDPQYYLFPNKLDLLERLYSEWKKSMDDLANNGPKYYLTPEEYASKTPNFIDRNSILFKPTKTANAITAQKTEEEKINVGKFLNGILEQTKNIAGNPYFAPAMSNLNSLFKAQKESGKNPYSLLVHDANPALYKAIEYTPFGERQVYKPIDRNYFTNLILANATAARSNALNITGGNKAAASLASLLHNYVGNTKLGDAISKIDEANYTKYNLVVGANNALALANAAQKYNIDSANVTNYNNYNNTKYNRDLSNAAAQYQAEQERKAAILEYSAGIADNIRVGKIYLTKVNLANQPGYAYSTDVMGLRTFFNEGGSTTENNKEGKEEKHASGGKLDLAFPYLEEWKKIRNK